MILTFNQALQFIVWAVAAAEIILGLYILLLNIWHRANQHMSAYLAFLGVNTFALGAMVAAENVNQAAFPSYILAATTTALQPMQLLLTVVLLKPTWLTGRWKWAWRSLYALILTPGLLTILDLVAGTRWWYSGVDAAYAGGFIPVSQLTAGIASPYVRALMFANAIFSAPLMLYVALLDHGEKRSTRRLAWILLIPWIASFAIQIGLNNIIRTEVNAFIISIIGAAFYAYAAFAQMVSERRLQRGGLQNRLTLLIFATGLPILAMVAFFIISGAGILLRNDAIERMGDINRSLSSNVAQWLDLNTKALRQMTLQPEIISMDAARQQPVLEAMASAYPRMYLVSTIDLSGMNVARNDRKTLTAYSDRSYFQQAAAGEPVAYQTLIGRTINAPALVVAMPIRDSMGQIVGVGMFASELKALSDEMLVSRIGSTGYSFVVDQQGKLLAHPDKDFLLAINEKGETELRDMSAFKPVEWLRQSSANRGPYSFTDEEGISWQAYVDTMENGWGVIVLQQESEVLARTQQLRQAALLIILLGTGILITFTWLTVRQALRPIVTLTESAAAISQGDLTRFTPVESSDEIGILAQSFNAMTERLRTLVGGLEQRVAERTEDLQKQAVQLQTAAEIARDAASVRQVEALLDRSVNIIQERFGYYQVSLFLLDDQGKMALLKAATGGAGQTIIKRGFRLKIGEIGIVSSVASSGMPRIVNDVNLDFSYVKHPLLPDTRAEMALPLKVGERVIGVLDIQSSLINAFDEKELSVLQIIADQLAVAIENARLLEELQNSLRETNVLYQRFAQDSWARATRSDRPTGYEYDLSQVVPVTHRLSDESLAQIHTGQTVRVKEGSNASKLIAPLMVYGQVVGVIGLEENDPQHEWTPEEVAIVETVTNQVALALDNARLLEETQLRSDQLRLLQEVTAAAASHVHLEEILNDVAQRLRTGFDTLHCGVLLFDPGNKVGTVVANASREAGAPSVVGVQIPLEGNPTIEMVIQARKTISVYNIQTDERMKVLHDLMRQRGTHTLIVIPLISRGEVIGTIGLDEDDPKRRFDNDELRLMDQISLQTAAAIDVARSFERAVQRAERERRLSEITGQIRSTLDIDSVIKTAVREVQRSLGLPEVVIRLGSPDGAMTNPPTEDTPAQ